MNDRVDLKTQNRDVWIGGKRKCGRERELKGEKGNWQTWATLAVAQCKSSFAGEKSSGSWAGGERAKNWAAWQMTERNVEGGEVRRKGENTAGLLKFF